MHGTYPPSNTYIPVDSKYPPCITINIIWLSLMLIHTRRYQVGQRTRYHFFEILRASFPHQAEYLQVQLEREIFEWWISRFMLVYAADLGQLHCKFATECWARCCAVERLVVQALTLWFLNGGLYLLQAQMPNIRSSHHRFIIPLLFLELTFAYTWLEFRKIWPSLAVHACQKTFQTKFSCKSSRSCL